MRYSAGLLLILLFSNTLFSATQYNNTSNVACCIGITGNIDCDPSSVVDIADLTTLIDHFFIGLQPLCCKDEGNVDGDVSGVVDIADLTFLIDHLFINFPPTSVCAGMEPGNASYIVTFESIWSGVTHPNSFPSTPHYSGLIGATHNSNVNFWIPGQLSSTGIKEMAELGSKTKLIEEVQAATTNGNVGTLLSGGGISPSPGSVSLAFEITSEFPLVSLVAMIAPSPDWFVGVHDLPLLQSGNWLDTVVVTLFAYDAGTDDGTIYTSSNAITTPPEPIFQLMTTPFLVNSVIPPMGTYTFIKQ